MTSATPFTDKPQTAATRAATPCARYLCTACGWIYDEAEGFPDEDIDPGTPWGEVPDAFLCPDCGLGKELFRKLED